jgi:hypothetical protein
MADNATQQGDIQLSTPTLMKTINIDGVGNFDVPAEYNDEQIKQHIQGLKQSKPELFGLPPNFPKDISPEAKAQRLTDLPGQPGLQPAQGHAPDIQTDAQMLGSSAMGALKGLGSTVYNAAKLTREGMNHIPIVNDLANKISPQFPENKPSELVPKAPENPHDLASPEGVGYYGEQLAEQALPSKWVGTGEKALDAAVKAPKMSAVPGIIRQALKYGGNALMEGAQQGGMEALHGGNADDVKNAAEIGAGGSVILPALAGAGNYIKTKMAPGIMNRLVNTLKPEYRFGRNPGKTLSEMGITGTSLEDLGNNIQRNIDDVHGQVNTALASNPNKVDVLPTLNKEINDALYSAKQNSDTELINQINAIKKRWTHLPTRSGTPFPAQRPNMVMSLPEINKLKHDISEAVTWTGSGYDKDINQLRVKMARSLSNVVDNQLGQLPNGQRYKELNQLEAGLIGAKKSLQNNIINDMKKSGLSLKEALVSAGAGGLGLLHGGTPEAIAASVATYAGGKAANSTLVRSQMGANVLPKAGTAIEKIGGTPTGRGVVGGMINKGGNDEPPLQALNQLEEGHRTTFRNGQVWTRIKGKPTRIQ